MRARGVVRALFVLRARVRNLEEQLARWEGPIIDAQARNWGHLRAERDDALADNARLRDALSVYAERGYYTGWLVQQDKGAIARLVLGKPAPKRTEARSS